MRSYDKAFLLDTLLPAAQKTNFVEFAEFQLKTSNEFEPRLAADYLTLNTIHLNKNFGVEGDITSFVANTSIKAIPAYHKNFIYDNVTPQSFLRLGSAFFAESFFASDEEWIESNIFKNHCELFGFHKILLVTFQIPHQKKTFIAFHYIRDKGENFDSSLREEDIEFLAYPFFLCWLFQFNIICVETLKDWLSNCVGMTMPRFQVLRALAGQQIASTKVLAESLELGQSSIHRHMERAFENLVRTDSKFASDRGNANRMVALSQAYRFMEFGPGDIGRTYMRRKDKQNGIIMPSHNLKV